MIDVFYDLNTVELHDSPDPLFRFFDLLPIEDPANLIPMPMRYTPCIHAKALGSRLGLPNLFLKDESVLPTGTTKDRMAAVSVSYMRECGVDTFCASSTGNSSTGFAHAVTYCPEMRMFIFTAEDFASRVHYEDNDRIVHFVLRDASFVDAQNCAKAFARRHSLVSEGGFFNPARREGLKLAFLEAVEQVPGDIDWYVQAISSAMGVYGAYKGAQELHAIGRISRLPRLMCVQQESCAPLARAFQEGCEAIQPKHVVPRPAGIASAILRGDPTQAYPYIRQIVLESNGTCIVVTEREIRNSRRMVQDLEGLNPCFSASCALAGLAHMARDGSLNGSDRILVNLTGSDRPTPSAWPRRHLLCRDGGDWQAADLNDALTVALWNSPRETMSL
jgi:threonine synthase